LGHEVGKQVSEHARLHVEEKRWWVRLPKRLLALVGGFIGAMLLAVFVLVVSGVIAALVGRV